ncbi:putative thy-1 membrane glycoprotein isoform X1 [Apostichopus japonicus]|uniref:Putative thy-1 membrane glycoprotein isoform X1 n=1 Tax=Stichopus japonicus TaxID=307972 RepID=A0A2G8JU33_STIJA|nr:putative thy-1 membrane glycoprotein isoform X1 [Apostichopus japonicus]
MEFKCLQQGSSAQQDHKHNEQNFVGDYVTMYIEIAGVKTKCVLDTGSQVTTIDEKYANRHFRDSKRPKEDITWLKLKAANGLSLPYSAYMEVGVKVMGIDLPKAGILIVKESTTPQTPCLLGLNVIRHLQQRLFSSLGQGYLQTMNGVEPKVQQIFKAMEEDCNFAGKDGQVGFVRPAVHNYVVIPARSELIITGKCRQLGKGKSYIAMIEPMEQRNLPRNVKIAKSLAEVKDGNIPVRVMNANPYEVKLHGSMKLGKLFKIENQDIDTTSHTDLEFIDEDTVEVGINLQQATVAPQSKDIDINSAILTPNQEMQLHELLHRHRGVFSTGSADLGHATTIQHRIPTGDTPPIKERHRRIPPQMYQEVKQHIRDMLEHGVIKESHSPWAAPIVIVKKKDGSLRFCVDYRKLNAKTRKDAHPLPRIEEALDALNNAQYFSTLDLATLYGELPGDLHYETLLIYIDDIIVFSRNFETHLQRLDEVFQRLEKHGLKIKPSKCHLFQEEIGYLGHVVSSKGIATDPEKTAVVEKWEAPRNAKEVRSFLGLAGYYRRFIKGFSKIAGPLYDLVGATTKKSGKEVTPKQNSFQWLSKQQEAFEKLKKSLTTAPVLSYPDYTKPFIVHTDASAQGLGAVLSQVSDGQEKVIAFASRTLRPARRMILTTQHSS